MVLLWYNTIVKGGDRLNNEYFKEYILIFIVLAKLISLFSGGEKWKKKLI